MTTPPPQLPFPIEPGWDYILTEADRQRFSPKQPTDEYCCCGIATTPSWHTADHSPNFHAAYHYRRRKPASGWVRVTDCLPPTREMVPVAENGHKMSVAYMEGFKWYNAEQKTLANEFTHWFRIPPPPEPEREAWEVAFDAADKEAQSKLVGPTADCWAFTTTERKASFKAGWDAKAKEGK